MKSVHTLDWARVSKVMTQYVAEQLDSLELEFRLISGTGESERWAMVKGQAVERNALGRPLRIVGTLSDITRRKLADLALREREQRLSRVLEGSDQGYWDWNVQTNDLVVSSRWETMLGYGPGEMELSRGQWKQVVHPDDLASTMNQVGRHLQGQTPMFAIELRCRTNTGDWCWVLSRGKVVARDAQAQPLMVSGTHTDISERKKFEQSQRQALTVFANSYEGIMVVDAQRLIVDVNPAFTRITGYSHDEVVGKSPAILASGRQSADFYKEMWRSILDTGHWRGEIWNRRKGGEIYAQMLSVSAVSDVDGLTQHYIGIFTDISQLKAHEEELDRIAHYDPLTGTPNRRLLVDRLAQAIARSNRNEQPLAVCFLDLDGFKAVNDRFGHATGDKLLIGITDQLKLVLRAEDTLARIGGDEFVLLLADIGSTQECSQILERILNSVSRPQEIDGNSFSISASIGVSLYPQDHADGETLMRHADQAMYAAKNAGKNRFHLFDLDSDRKVNEHRKFVDRLAIALEQKEFRLHYQPQVDLRTGHIVGVEALIRWQHPDHGLLSPSEFLLYIEGSTLERPVGNWVLHTALHQMQQWRTLGLAVHVSVNVSARHLLSPEFEEDVRKALAVHADLLPQWLELEILESTAIDDLAIAASVLQKCRAIGVRLALDDFGTGYSSLTHLRKLPFDLLKIDQSFVRDMLKDPEDQGIVEGVIRLAAAFNRDVIAEGVETLEHGSALLRLGCRLAQGYGIARPMAPEQFVDWSLGWNGEQPWRLLH
jgi:diguanylate cyclase (GGDEF)-like protein/PAS domain S-box-containing protein